MSEAVQEYTKEERVALAQMADALARFGNAMEACAAVGINLPSALQACGIAIPSWAAAFVAQLPTPGVAEAITE